ncbi:unnamed protein product [Colias eurytheme]|nr:unnamed protein product [Colias eurytheme]
MPPVPKVSPLLAQLPPTNQEGRSHGHDETAEGETQGPPRPDDRRTRPTGRTDGRFIDGRGQHAKSGSGGHTKEKEEAEEKQDRRDEAPPSNVEPNDEPQAPQIVGRAAAAAEDKQKKPRAREFPRQASHDPPRQREEVAVLVKIMIDVLNAVLNDESPVTAVVQGLSKILELHNGR